MVSRRAVVLPKDPESFTENDLQDQLVSTVKGHEGLAIILGWEVLHIRAGRQRPGRGGWAVPIQGSLGKGWPDLILAKPPRLVAVELKRHPNKPTEDQLRVLSVLAACGVETFVWYPEDLELAGAILSGTRGVSRDTSR
jgi:hypothetical protein